MSNTVFKWFFISNCTSQNGVGDNSPHRAKITNHQQVRDDLDQCGFSVSKLWNVGRYDIQQQWDDEGEIPDEAGVETPRTRQ